MNFITLLDYVGTFAFAISGIRLASAKHFDWFGAYVVGFVTAVGGGTLRGDLQSWMARLKGKEDPNSKIGSDAATHMGEKFLALDDVSFEVKKGEALGIIGHNGAGKSTLLKLLSRVTAPTKGTISYNGRVASMLEVGTGFHPELTGRENVYMNGAILGMTRAEIDRKFDQIVELRRWKSSSTRR